MLSIMNAPLFTMPSNLSAFLKYSRAIGFKGLPAFGCAEGDQGYFVPISLKIYSIFCNAEVNRSIMVNLEFLILKISYEIHCESFFFD